MKRGYKFTDSCPHGCADCDCMYTELDDTVGSKDWKTKATECAVAVDACHVDQVIAVLEGGEVRYDNLAIACKELSEKHPCMFTQRVPQPVEKPMNHTREAINSAALGCAQLLNRIIGMSDDQIDWAVAAQDAGDLDDAVHSILAGIEEAGEPEPKTSVEVEPSVERAPKPYDPYWRQERDFNRDYDNGR